MAGCRPATACRRCAGRRARSCGRRRRGSDRASATALASAFGFVSEVVGRRHGFGEERHGEVGPDAALVVELHLVDEPVGGARSDEVRLHEAVQERVVAARPASVKRRSPALGGDLAAADGDVGGARRRRRAPSPTAAPGSTATRWPSRPRAAVSWRRGRGRRRGWRRGPAGRRGRRSSGVHRSVTPPSTTSTCPVA